MSHERARVSVNILGKEYQVACAAEERDDLIDSAKLLDSNMRTIRDSGKVVGLDRIAVMAALNLANELIRLQHSGDRIDEPTCARIRQMRERLEATLTEAQQLEF